MRVFIITIFFVFSMLPNLTLAQESDIKKKELAIVIDDFGNNMKGTEEMLESSHFYYSSDYALFINNCKGCAISQ